jgi:hypothetical protein
MNSGELMSLPVFWARNGLSKTNYYYLKRLGRGPQVISLGTKDMVSPEAEAAWRSAMAESPIKGSLRKHALEVEAEAA